jgi:hypothetical protein
VQLPQSGLSSVRSSFDLHDLTEFVGYIYGEDSATQNEPRQPHVLQSDIRWEVCREVFMSMLCLSSKSSSDLDPGIYQLQDLISV